MRPRFTVVIPARNEASSIEGAIDSVGAQDVDLSTVEVVVVDGTSDDDTADVAKRALDRHPFRRSDVVGNLERRTPSNLNRGLLWADGELLVRVDARSRIPPNYLRLTAEALDNESVAVAGGRQMAVPHDRSVRALGIARALNNSLAMGWSRYRRNGAESGTADTVYLGVFRVAQLADAGGWSDRFATNQDFELNRRMSAFGDVWFDQRLEVAYLPRRRLTELLQQYHRFGRWKVAYWRETGDRPQRRQQVMVALPVGAGVGLIGATIVLGPTVVAASAGGGAAALLAVDHFGSNGDPAPPAVRVVAATVNGLIALGWVSGVMRSLLGADPLSSNRRR